MNFNAFLGYSQNIGINQTGTNAHPSALLDLDANPTNNTGFLMPRLTTVQRHSIASPADGLQVYDLNLHGVYHYITSISKWDCLTVPAGVVGHFANVTAPIGYLTCDGSAVSRVIYPELFNAIGTLYGIGDGATTFNLPDLRGEFIRGAALTGTVDAGRILGSKQVDCIQNITGQIGNMQQVYGATCSQDGVFVNSISSGAHGDYLSYTSPAINYQGSSDIVFDASTVVRTSSETRGKNIALLPCIKY